MGSWTNEQVIGLLDRNGGAAGYKEEKTGLGPSYRKWRQGDGVAAVFMLNKLTLTHPMLERRYARLKAKAEVESKRAPKFLDRERATNACRHRSGVSVGEKWQSGAALSSQ